MSDDVQSKEISNKGEVPNKADSKNRLAFGLWLLAIIALIAIGASVAVYLQVAKLKTDGSKLASNLMPLETKLNGLENLLAESQRTSQKLAGQLQELQQQQSSLAENHQLLIRQAYMSNNDWALAEVEHLIIVATHRLQLEKNVELALAAMQAADNRLKNINEPGLLSVRQQLTSDINALKAVDAVDISGLVLYLSDLVGRVVELPLRHAQVINNVGNTKEPEKSAGNWDKLLSSVWQELRSLVQISRQGQETLATLLPEQQYFLYQNLRLQLESARYAVLRRDTENLHVSVDIITAWLSDYFDGRNVAVSNIVESMSKMSELQLNPDLPDISSSLESLRAYSKAQSVPDQVNNETSIEKGQ